MKIFVFLSLLSLVYSAPAPKDETLEPRLEAVPYEHDATGDVAEAYIHEEIEALPYVHQEIPDEEISEEAKPAVIPQPVVAYSYAPFALTNYAALPKAAAGPDGIKLALIPPFHLVAGGYNTVSLQPCGCIKECLLYHPALPCHL